MTPIRRPYWHTECTVMLMVLVAMTLPMLLPSPSLALPMREATVVLHTQSGSHRFQVEIAETSEQQQRGLMFRKSLPAESGMLFPLSPMRRVTMWMKDTLIPLDMVFLDNKMKVQYIYPQATPRSLVPIRPHYTHESHSSAYVLELNAGIAKAIELEEGDQMEILLPAPQQAETRPTETPPVENADAAPASDGAKEAVKE